MQFVLKSEPVKGWSPLYGDPRKVVKESGKCQGSHRYRGYDFYMEIYKTRYYESPSMAEKSMKKEINAWKQKVDEGKEIWNLMKSSGCNTYFKSMEVKEKPHIIAHLFNIAGEEGMEGMIEQLNQSKIPSGLREAFQSNNCPVTGEAKVASVEDRWLITDGMEMYSVEKGEEQLKIYTSCRRTDILVESDEWLQTYSYLIKGPVVYRFRCYGDDMIYEDMVEKYFEPMLATFEPIVVITEPT